MSNIVSSNTTSASNTKTDNSAATSSKNLMGTTDQFLKILLAQLKYQDPLEPMKGTEFIDSISRLSTVEQAINSNKHLEEMTNILRGANSYTGNPVSYIDKNIEFNSSAINLTNKSSSFSYTLPAEDTPKDVDIAIKDATGKVVLNAKGTVSAGANTISWNGTDNDGNQLRDGMYTVSVTYPDPENVNRPKEEAASISLATYTTGKVSEADFTGSEPMLKIGSVTIPLTAIRKLYSLS